MNKDELLKIRQQLVDKTRQMALNDTNDPVERMDILLGLIRSGDMSRDLMDNAMKTVDQLPEEARLDVYLDLIFEIDAQLGVDADEQTD